jgi:hypothetical protein
VDLIRHNDSAKRKLNIFKNKSGKITLLGYTDEKKKLSMR